MCSYCPEKKGYSTTTDFTNFTPQNVTQPTHNINGADDSLPSNPSIDSINSACTNFTADMDVVTNDPTCTNCGFEESEHILDY